MGTRGMGLPHRCHAVCNGRIRHARLMGSTGLNQRGFVGRLDLPVMINVTID
jgi:hypothetical protein